MVRDLTLHKGSGTVPWVAASIPKWFLSIFPMTFMTGIINPNSDRLREVSTTGPRLRMQGDSVLVL